MKKLFFALGLALALCAGGTAQAADFTKMTIRAATANPPGSLHVTAIEKF
jgi:TRAP-type C4-dicarboxylate transport system substrate-binding protein